MTLAYYMVLAAALLPYLWAVLSKTGSTYNHAAPRLQEKQGWRLRAQWAQANAWEAFPPFAAAVIIAQLTTRPQSSVNMLALAFVGFRLAHGLAYLANWSSVRSLVWGGGFFCVVALFVVPD